jgi:hypothetical protein
MMLASPAEDSVRMTDCVLEPMTTDPVIVELPLDVGES